MALHEPTASLFPLDQSGEVVALRACVDAGTQENVFCVAAVAFGYDRAVKANREWSGVLKGRTFHMTDLHARQEDFEGIDDGEVHGIMVGTVGAIKKHASFSVAISCDASLIANSLPTVCANHPDMTNLLAAMRSSYGFMCHFAMSALGSLANNNRTGRQISYVFESGDKGQRGLKRYLEFLDEGETHHRLFLNSYSFNRLTVTPKEELEGIFHSADLLAWEWARHVDRHKHGKRMRRSLAELAGRDSAIEDDYGITLSNGSSFFCRHFERERLEAFTAFYRDNLAATTPEEQHAAFYRYREKYPGPGPEEALARLYRGGS